MAVPPEKAELGLASRRPRGRPRSSETRQSMLGAAADILRDEGLQGFSISAVASRSGSSRTTVYRRWPSRDVLLLDALAEVFAGDPVASDGDLLATLRSIGRDRRDVIRDRVFLAALPLVVQLSVGRTSLSDQAKEQLLSPQREAFVRSYEELAAQKLVRTDTDPEMLLCMLLGAILYRVLLSLKIGNRELDQLSMLIMAAVQPVGPPT
jgi:AcrR family transcriptional regulator